MAKFTLEIEEDFDFRLIGIYSHIKDYRLCWFINQELQIDLQKDNNLDLSSKNNEQEHTLYAFIDEEDLIEYYLIGNRSENGWLIPEEKCDYFLLIKGHVRDAWISEIIETIKQLNAVLATTEIIVEDLKSKENLIF